jgi:transcriptional regulator with XRE-family HTH domain
MGYRQVNYGIPAIEEQWLPMEERNTNDETMGQRIKRLREAKNLTQPALANLLVAMGATSTTSKATVGKWENGETKNMANETFVLLYKALGTDPEYLVWGPDRAPPERPRAPSVRVTKR